jgi:putative selenate reductase FAD-binding subunit
MIEQFHRPATVREALTLKKRFQSRGVFLAGGTYVNSSACASCPERPTSLAGGGFDRVDRRQGAMATGLACSRPCTVRPAHIISLAGLGLDRVEAKQGVVSIGACCTLQRLIEDRKVPAPLKAAIALIVSRNVREAATLGGHVAGNLPSSDVIPMLVALGAKVGLSLPGASKAILVEDYVRRPVAGLITRIVVAQPKAGRLAACRNARASANARSIVSAAVSLTVARKAVMDPIIALGGLGGHVVRLTTVEEALSGKPLPALDELQALVGRAVRPAADPAGSAAFRRHQAGVTVALALHDALGRKRSRS